MAARAFAKAALRAAAAAASVSAAPVRLGGAAGKAVSSSTQRSPPSPTTTMLAMMSRMSPHGGRGSVVTANARRGFISLPSSSSTAGPRQGLEWMTSRVKELKAAADAQVEAAKRAPSALKHAARHRAHLALERLVGPRAAASIMSGSTSLNPLTRARTTVMRCRAFAARHRGPIVLITGGVAVVAVWRGMLAAASLVTEATDAVTELTMLGLSVSLVVIGGWHLRQRSVVNAEHVYAATMRRLEQHHGLLEVLGAPIVGSELRALVTTKGGWRVSGMAPRWRPAKLHLVFPIAAGVPSSFPSLPCVVNYFYLTSTQNKLPGFTRCGGLQRQRGNMKSRVTAPFTEHSVR